MIEDKFSQQIRHWNLVEMTARKLLEMEGASLETVMASYPFMGLLGNLRGILNEEAKCGDEHAEILSAAIRAVPEKSEAVDYRTVLEVCETVAHHKKFFIDTACLPAVQGFDSNAANAFLDKLVNAVKPTS